MSEKNLKLTRKRNNMIDLNPHQIEVIKTIKHQYPEKLKGKKSWFGRLQSTYSETFAYEYENTPECKSMMADNLLDIWMLIKYDHSGCEIQLKAILFAALYKSAVRPQRKGIDRVISQLCGLIQSNPIIERDGTPRYQLQ